MARTFTDDDDSTVEVIQAYFPFLPGLQVILFAELVAELII